MNHTSILETALDAVQQVLNGYYHFNEVYSLNQFLIKDHTPDLKNGRVIFEEVVETSEMFIGIEFGKIFLDNLGMHTSLSDFSLNEIAVIAEEVSHFYLLCEAYSRQQMITELDLETLGEVDRFLALLAFAPGHWKNLHDACDTIMTGLNRFENTKSVLYMKAETAALRVIKQAFEHCWDNSHFDFSVANLKAANFLKTFRQSLFAEVRSGF